MIRRISAFLIAATLFAAPAVSRADSYVPTYDANGNYKGCTRYDDYGNPMVTYLNVGLVRCVFAGLFAAGAGPVRYRIAADDGNEPPRLQLDESDFDLYVPIAP